MEYIPINGHYINGFIAGDGCLALDLSNKNFCIILQITQEINKKKIFLLFYIVDYLKYSKFYRDGPKIATDFVRKKTKRK